MEQRHGEVADVRRLERVHLRHDRPDAGQPALATQARLRRARGPRCEEEIAEGLRRHRAVGHVCRRGRGIRRQGALPDRGVDHEHPLVVAPDQPERLPDARAFHQRQVRRVRDEELALGVREVPHQLVSAMRRVGPDHHRAGQSGRLEPEDELGDVVEHEGDMERAVVARGLQPGRPRRGPGHHLGVAQAEVVRHQAEARDVGPGQYRAGDGFRCRRRCRHRSGVRCCRMRIGMGHCISKCL